MIQRLSGLGLAAALGSDVASAATRSEATAARVALEATTTALAASTVSTATGTAPTSTKVSVSTVSVRTRTALLDNDLLRSDLVGIGSNGGGVSSRVGELNKGTVLR